jgi:two-component system nitrate/nitrite response regulator NarL
VELERHLILIVDDDEDARSFVSRLLARAGFATVEANSGEQALVVAARGKTPALVLLEVGLPDGNGFEMCIELREEFGDLLPIVFLSGARTEALDRAVGLLLGGDDYLVKPVDPDELLARVRRLLARSGLERARPAGARRDLGLTGRELEILRGLAEGLAPIEIASQLVISPKTVSNHIQRVLEKLGVHSRAQAVALAYELGVMNSSTADDGEGQAPGS